MGVRIERENWMNWCRNMAAVPKDGSLVWLQLEDGQVDLAKWDGGEWVAEFGLLHLQIVAWCRVTV